MRIRDAASTLGYEPSYAHQLIPKLLPVYRARDTENGPLVVKKDDLDAYIAKVLAQPVKVPA